jgi:hypothetical protein
VRTDLNALLTALYVRIDDHLQSRVRPGRPPRLTDAELLTLAAAQALLGVHSEARWLRLVPAALPGAFPYLPGQSGYNKRLRTALPLLKRVIRVLAADTDLWTDPVWLVDSTPVECARSRPTAQRSNLAGFAGYGYCASHSRYYWGLKLYLVCTGDGMPIMWCLANPKIGERQVLAALLDHNHPLIRDSQVLLADKGFSGKAFKKLTETMALRLLRPDRKDETYRNGNLSGVRQWIESVNQTLKGQLSLEHHGGRTPAGVLTRVTQRLLAMAAGIWHNWTTDVTSKRSLIPHDH